VRKFVFLYEAPDCRCYRGQLVVGEVNCRHGGEPSIFEFCYFFFGVSAKNGCEDEHYADDRQSDEKLHPCRTVGWNLPSIQSWKSGKFSP
jgi:hypothetical protein